VRVTVVDIGYWSMFHYIQQQAQCQPADASSLHPYETCCYKVFYKVFIVVKFLQVAEKSYP